MRSKGGEVAVEGGEEGKTDGHQVRARKRSLGSSTHERGLEQDGSGSSGDGDSLASHDSFAEVARALKSARTKRGLTQRQVAAAARVSAGLIAQIETGRTRPSVRTLLNIGQALDLSLDNLLTAELEGPDPDGPQSGTTDGPFDGFVQSGPNPPPERSGVVTPIEGHVVRGGSRKTITLESGVEWSLLTSEVQHGMSFILVTYPPGSASSSLRQFVRHDDNEYFFLLDGNLHVHLAFEETELHPGDSMSFDSSVPHRFENRTDSPASGVWCIIRKPEFPGMQVT